MHSMKVKGFFQLSDFKGSRQEIQWISEIGWISSRVKSTMKSVDLSEILWISWNLVDFGEILVDVMKLL